MNDKGHSQHSESSNGTLCREPWTKPKILLIMGLPRWLSDKESAASAGDTGNAGSIPGLGRSHGGGNGNPLQDSCLENPQGHRSLAGYSPWSGKELDTTQRLNNNRYLGTFLLRNTFQEKGCLDIMGEVSKHIFLLDSQLTLLVKVKISLGKVLCLKNDQ